MDWNTIVHVLNVIGEVLIGAACLVGVLVLIGCLMLAGAEARGENPFM